MNTRLKTGSKTATLNHGEHIMIKGSPVIILLVEDDPAHAEIVRRNLGSFRVANRIIHMEDGQAALDYLLRHAPYANPKTSPRPNLILLDLRLPKVDGMEVLRRIKEDEELKRIPTVILTTSGAESDLVNAYTHGAGSYLVKPVDFEKFSKLMEAFGFYWLAWNRFPD
jgi:CheY-like chemotaxis protein